MNSISIGLSWIAILFGCVCARGDATVEIAQPGSYSQVLALSDVHGMYDPLIQLLSRARVIDASRHWIAGKTLLIVVGDSIDKGPRSLDVLDLWISLSEQAQASGGRLVHVLGNHEAEFLAYGKKDSKSTELLDELKQRGVHVRELRDGDGPRARFLRQMPLALKVGRWIFCHSGYFPEMSWSEFAQKASLALKSGDYENELLLGEDSVLEAKDWWQKHKHRRKLEERLEAQGVFGVVQGHQPKAYGIADHIGAIDGGKLVKLDTGMSPPAGAHPGELLRIAAPAQLSEMKSPKLEVIDAAGKPHSLELQ